jgi:large subunit ribosomal protein L17
MNHKSGFNALERTTAHRKAMIRNMCTSLFRYGRITTTKAKALEVRKFAEKLITRSKVDTVHNRRHVARFITDKTVLAKLFLDIGKSMKDRPGGYTRILKLGFRQGDAAEVVLLELVTFKLPDPAITEAKKEAKEKRKEAKTAKAEGKEEKDKAEKPAKPAPKAKAKAPAEKKAKPQAGKESTSHHRVAPQQAGGK